MPFFQTQLIGVSLKSVGTVIACSGVGAYARKKGVLDAKAQKVLDKLVSSILLPCLILGKVTPNLSFSGLQLIWPMGVMCICVVAYGLISGCILSALLSLRHPVAAAKYKGLMMVAIAFPNSFSVPMTLALALGDHPVLAWHSHPEGGEQLQQRIKMLFLLSYAIWVFARWSIGYPILSGAISFSEWRGKVLNPPVVACIMSATAGLIWSGWLHQFLPEELVEQALAPFVVAIDYGGRCSVPMILMSLGARLNDAIQEVMGSFGSSLKYCGYAKPVDPAKTPTDASLPADVIGLSGDVELPSMVDSSISAEESDADVPMPAAAYLGVLVLRQVVGPAVGALVACWLLRNTCHVHDTAVLLVALLQSAGPPMINISVMAGLSGSAEMETAKLLLLTYWFSIVSWTVSIAAYLWLLG